MTAAPYALPLRIRKHDESFAVEAALAAMKSERQKRSVAKDVCEALGIANSRDAAAKLDDDEKGVALTDTLGGKQELLIISESGLYALALRCRDALILSFQTRPPSCDQTLEFGFRHSRDLLRAARQFLVYAGVREGWNWRFFAGTANDASSDELAARPERQPDAFLLRADEFTKAPLMKGWRAHIVHGSRDAPNPVAGRRSPEKR